MVPIGESQERGSEPRLPTKILTVASWRYVGTVGKG